MECGLLYVTVDLFMRYLQCNTSLILPHLSSAPPFENILIWIQKANVSETYQNLFLLLWHCLITKAVKGGEDDKISCFKGTKVRHDNEINCGVYEDEE